ncbi:MAG: NAD-dependent epimerase/dehydratase family protein [Solirubrobacteraceae bacterium]
MGVTLVTGGSGFIGSHVARALLERVQRVRVTVRARARLDSLEGLDVERAQCDLLDRRQVPRVRKGVDRLFSSTARG